MFKALICAGAAAGLFALVGCDDGSAEKAGENLDSAVEEATQGHENKSDGAFEKAGEAIDKTTGQNNPDAADALRDATDGDRGTKPD